MQSQRNCGEFNRENQSVSNDIPGNVSGNVPSNVPSTSGPSDFHGASLINDEGVETPITESMVQDAFQTLIDAWEQQRLAGNLPSKVQNIQPIPN